MAHVNVQVRDAFLARVQTVAELATASKQRSANLADTDLPAAIVHQLDDDVEQRTKARGLDTLEERDIDVTVTLVADGDDEDVADELTAIRSAVEQAIAIDDDLGGLAHGVEHTGMELELLPDEEGERWYAVMVLGWTVTVWTNRGDPETAV